MNYTRIVAGGFAGTVAMTMVGVWIAPMMGLAPMNPATMLAAAMGGSAILGWLAHFMIGVTLAFAYSLVSAKLPGSYPVRGALFAIAPWLLAQLVVMPMMGMPLFSGSMMMAMGSLVGHLVYGAIVGAIVGAVASPIVRPTARNAAT